MGRPFKPRVQPNPERLREWNENRRMPWPEWYRRGIMPQQSSPIVDLGNNVKPQITETVSPKGAYPQ